MTRGMPYTSLKCWVHDPESRGGERVLLAVTTPSALDFYVLSNALLISVALTVHKAAQRLVWALRCARL